MSNDSEGGAVEGPALVPVRMLNELIFCARLFYLEHVQGEFVDNEHTLEGKLGHRRVDARDGALPEREREAPVAGAGATEADPTTASSEEEAAGAGDVAVPRLVSRSIALSSERLGLSARIDLVETEGDEACPVDYKRGRPPENAERCHEPERVQLCAYGLLLREHGYQSRRGYLYFIGSKERVEVPFDAALEARTLQALEELRTTSAGSQIPPPLRDSPKCDGCSLHGICLPDEVNHLAAAQTAPLRRVLPANDDAVPLYVQANGVKVGLSGDCLQVRDPDRKVLAEARLFETSQVVLLGNVQVTTQALRELCDRGIPVCFMSGAGWFYGVAEGLGHRNVELRLAQFRAAEDPVRSLGLARRFVRTKIANCRTLLRRNHGAAPESVLQELAAQQEVVDGAAGPPELLGIEGNAARLYFSELPGMLRPKVADGAFTFEFTTRSRRPPRDPVNALLSFAYAMLVRELTVALRRVGFDPFLGFYHRPRYGRPALALDLMEEFRPLLADSAVISAVNTGVVTTKDFVRTGLGVALKPEGKKRFIRAYERRLGELVTHPVFGYRISYRRVLDVQCRLLARFLLGELPEYPEFRTR